MTNQELETQLLALTPTEKAEAIQILTKTLNQSRYPITKTPGVCGEEASSSSFRRNFYCTLKPT